jgi:hypothetical protein
MPPGPGYGPPYGNDRTNGLAVAAFVTGLLGCFGILGIILGAISLGQIGRNGGRGRGFAVAGIVLSCLWILTSVTIGVIVVARDSGGGSSDTGAVPRVTATKPKEVDARTMKLGDCINDNTTASNPSATEPVEVDSVKIVPCTGLHDGEVTAVFRLPGSVLPPDSRLRELASSGCKIRTRARINRDPAAGSLANSYYYPTADSWRSGDRTVTCVVVSATEGRKLTRPLRP